MPKTIEIPIKGMSCSACAQAIQRAISRIDGVISASVNLLTEMATVEANDNVNIKRIVSIVRATGYDIGSVKFYIYPEYLDADIFRLISERLTGIDGIIDTRGDTIGKNIVIEYIPTIISENKILSLIHSFGIKATKQTDTATAEEEKVREFKRLKRDLIISILFTLPVFLGSMFHFPVLSNGFIQLIFVTPVQFLTGMRFHRLAFIALKHGTTNMNSLVSLGTNAAYFYSLFMLIFKHGDVHFYFETSAVIITLILFGRTLEERAKAKTSEALQKLIQLQPKKAFVIRDGKEQEIRTEDVVIGDIVVVRQSEKIPIDGIIVEGNGTIDESMITGEPIPVDKSIGEKVIGGTILINGVLKIEAKAVGKDSILSQIIKLIQDAQTGKPPVQRLADKISAIFVPSVLGVAIVTFILWMLFSKNVSLALSNSIAVLIISCPCALGLATPTAIMVATGRAAREGILIKHVEKLEEIGKIEVLFSDKTGTLTQGKPEVKDAKFFTEDINEVLALCATAEKYSEHPLARAILRYCVREGINPREPKKFEVISGGGISATVDDSEGIPRRILIGSSKFMQKKNISIPEIIYPEPATTVYMSVDDEIKVVFLISDPLREESMDIVREIRKLGISLIIITGDNEKTAKAIADKLGIETFFSNMLPHEKAKIIRRFRVVDRKIVAMVGDGINDAPALAEANVGIAMGSGTDIAIHTSDVTLMSSGLRGIPTLIKLSKITLKTIKENLFWAFIYNVLGIPIAAGVLFVFGGPLLNPMIASLAMSLSSVSVVSNSLRLRKRKLN